MVVKINMKSPCQEDDDREIEAQSDWTVRKLKQEIERSWSFHPRPQDQRLVYAGKLLQDDEVVVDVLRYDEELNCHTMHLICRQTSFPSNKTNNNTNITGLRQRKAANSSQSESERYQNLLPSTSPGPSTSNSSSASNLNQHYSSNRAPSINGSEELNQWQMYLNSQANLANQNAQYLNQTPEQSIMMQQMYAHYMAQYMQYVQSGSIWPSSNINGATSGAITNPAYGQQFEQRIQNPPGAPGLNPMAAGAAVAAVVGGHTTGAPAGGPDQANQANIQNVPAQNGALPQVNAEVAQAAPAVPAMNAPGANPANVVMNAGAGGMGAMEEDDEDGMGGVGGHRDMLDWFYIASRVLVLFSIVYFYSSLARFALVAGLGLAVYLYRMGFFGQRLVGQAANANPINNNNVNPNNNNQQNRPIDERLQQDHQGRENHDEAANQDGEIDIGQNNVNNTEEIDQVNNNASLDPAMPVPVQLQQSWYQVATTFVTTFFTSLMPNEPQVI